MNFWDDKSNGFPWEDAKLRSVAAMERLFFGIATATRYRVVQGSEVVAPGHRREVDPHGFRGSSYFKDRLAVTEVCYDRKIAFDYRLVFEGRGGS